MTTVLENAKIQAEYAVYFEYRKMLNYIKLTADQENEIKQKVAEIEAANPDFKRAYEMK